MPFEADRLGMLKCLEPKHSDRSFLNAEGAQLFEYRFESLDILRDPKAYQIV